MILEHDGKTVDFFKKLFDQPEYNKIGVWVSGGADSAFCLWWLSKIINDNDLFNYSLIPVHGVDTARIADSSQSALAVTNFVKDYFPEVGIRSPYLFKYYKDPKDPNKGKYHDPIRERLKKQKYINIMINSYTKNPSKEIMIKNNFYKNRDEKRDNPTYGFEWHRPFAYVDKSFLAHFYRKYKLNDLYKLTVSCTGDIVDKKYPCEKCFWCKEKYWAFETYDGGSFEQ